MKIDKRPSVVIKLDFPFEFDGVLVSEVEMRRPKVRDSLRASKGKTDFDRSLELFANLIERPIELIGEFDEVDLEKLGVQYQAFTGRQDTTQES